VDLIKLLLREIIQAVGLIPALKRDEGKRWRQGRHGLPKGGK